MLPQRTRNHGPVALYKHSAPVRLSEPELRRRFHCNVCTLPNEVPMEYFAGLDHIGRRLDESQRPELTCATVEYVAPREYMVSFR